MIFKKYSKIKFYKHSSSGSRVVSCGRKDGRIERQTYTTKLIVAFCNFVEVPPNKIPFLLDSCADGQVFNPLNPELNPTSYLLALLGAHHFLHVSRIRVKLLSFRLLMSYIYIYGAPILDVSRSHTTTQHSR